MTTFDRENITFILKDDFCVWITFNPQLRVWSAESMVRVADGIRYRDLEYGMERPTVEMLRRDALRGFYSHRPFQLGSAVDPTMTHCVLALLGRFCAARGLDPQDLLKQAYPQDAYLAVRDFHEIAAQAEWEGTTFPSQWQEQEIGDLVFALSEIGYERVADLVEAMTGGGKS